MHAEFYSEKLREAETPRRWEDNIKMDFREVGCDAGDCIDLVEDKNQWQTYVRAVMNFRVP